MPPTIEPARFASHNQVVDVAPIANLASLRFLSASFNRIPSLESLVGTRASFSVRDVSFYGNPPSRNREDDRNPHW